MSPSERAGVCADFVEGMAVKEICTKYQISDRTFRLIKEKDNLDRARNSAIAAARSAEIKTAQDIIVVEAKTAVYRTAKAHLKVLIDDLAEVYANNRKNSEFKPKSLEGLANVLLKAIDVYGRLTDEDTQAAQEIEIRITGAPPAPPADAVTSFVVEHAALAPPDPSQLADGAGVPEPDP
jgi:hypothetical protein